jgi:5'-nucleotidase
MEGALAGVPSIALSQDYAREGMGDNVPFAAAEAWGAKVLAPRSMRRSNPVRS